ncbi:glycosyltransferase family 9 protein [Helicobacter pametensis]|uniref:glycosyltransferase family 9 protein n=1 Tax=Helicobacter pametensis TaxID=95149 RepID=UPI0004AD07EB|nr:glycosyltransferase family 9 protein [Helicobacter pametensis]
MKIGFYRDALIGDNLVSIPAMYAIKALYPASTLIVYTNTIGLELYEQYDFIDELYNMDHQSQEKIKDHINAHHFDIFLLTQANRWRCKLLNQTNVKKVISLLSLGSIFKPKFHTIFISRNLSPLSQSQRMFKLVREINPQIFDTQIHKIDFSPTILQTQPRHKEFIQSFLSPYKDYKTLVMINPFSRTCSHNLTLSGWLKLTQDLALLYPHILFIIPTYEGNPTPLEFETNLPNIAIFRNNSDLFNLIELISRLSLLISPSTGNAHIANNLHIPLLGLFSKRDRMLWRGENMKLENLIIIPATKEKMSKETEEELILETIEKFKTIIKSI